MLLFGQRERMTVFMPASANLFDPESFRLLDLRLIPQFVESFRFGRAYEMKVEKLYRHLGWKMKPELTRAAHA